jgi:hypothetical protein
MERHVSLPPDKIFLSRDSASEGRGLQKCAAMRPPSTGPEDDRAGAPLDAELLSDNEALGKTPGAFFTA